MFAYEFAAKELPDNCRVLELGAGEGYGTFELSQSGKVREITGLDIDPHSIDRAAKKYKSDKLSYKVYDGNRIPYDDNAFDAVISFQVIEHIRDDRNTITEIHRVLKNDGIFLLTTPNREIRLKAGQKPWNRFHIREYSSGSLRNLLVSSFNQTEISGVHGNDEVHSIEIERIREGMKLYAMDPFNLRSLIPAVIRTSLVRILHEFHSQSPHGEVDFISRYGTHDFYISGNDLAGSLDLLACCRKG
jgi:SAM-dependent methyltransferase